MVTASRHSDLQISYVRFLLHLSCCNRSGIWWVSCIPPAEHQIECAHRALILTQYMHPQLWERTGVILPSPCCFSSCPALGKPRDGAGFGAKTTILAQLLAGITSLGSTSVQIKLLSNFLQSQPAITWLSFWVLRDIIMRFNNKLFQFCIPCKFCWPGRIVHGKKPQTHSFLLIKFFIFPLFLLHHECNSWEKKKRKSKEVSISIPSICPLKSEMIKWVGKKSDVLGTTLYANQFLKSQWIHILKNTLVCKIEILFNKKLSKEVVIFGCTNQAPSKIRCFEKKIEAL